MSGLGGRAALRNDDRGVSETVGFVLVFALITTTIAVTLTVGLGGLEDVQLAERDNNVERAFDVLHDSFNDLGRDGVPSRATEIRLGGGRIAFTSDSSYAIRNATGAVIENSTTAITYFGAGDTRIRYEHGAVIRSDGEGSIMLHEPDLLFGETTLIRFVDVNSHGSDGVAGDGTVLVRASLTGDRTATEVTDDVTIQVRGPTADAWARYFESRRDGSGRIDSVNLTGDELTVNVSVSGGDRLVVHRTGTRVEFSD
ncbi:hypothetical protein C463_07332 [Halorubrum californiense DSM 19288]|uniref:Uncharacterized protein n=1 Tax=Halorubrum californiense DSM 19288 TaxID=1227465 RepID=M0EE88_9EURY|nr:MULTISPECIES: hypothetical protein [Halorubrum]ELZ44749.1 hypothetical protein C463_07332 [Halorubrum californiense DSM 19288]TKX71786.1 hypothetical protein EXE40_06875 [Halorubrum sp. GN11GM_10-3_MGM]